MSTRYERRVLEHVGHERYAPADVRGLAAELNVEASEEPLLRQAVETLRERGKVVVTPEGKVLLPAVGKEVVGRFKKHIRGFGFVTPLDAVREGDVFVPPDATGDALSGDTVLVSVSRRRKPGGAEELSGRVVRVVERKRGSFAGELTRRGSEWYVFPDGRELTEPVVIRDPSAKNAKAGDKVIIEITHYPEGGMLAEGVITKVLGEAGLPSVETQAVIAAYNLPGEFDERVSAQARRAAEAFSREVETGRHAGWKDREDLRERFIITIDPPDAKDYDDAIQIARFTEGGGGWDLGVHIADVSHFVPQGTPLDEEARKRGNSVYLPRLVIPMLPESLSNGVCSLQEGVERYCKSAFMRYDRQGRLVRSGVSQTVIRSAKRLTYLEAQALIDGDETEARRHAKTEPNYTPELLTALREMDACARAIRQRRRAAGMIHLELPEAVLVYDEDGRVIDALPEDGAFTHTIIEMFMVEANEVLARLFERLKVPLLRRIHPDPTPGDVDDLRTVAKVAGHVIPKSPTREELQKLLDATRGTPAAPAVHFAVLRTLTKAEYSPALVGHFALASEAYAHFTSPIRRYPDLTVHRAMAEYLRHTENGKRPPNTDGQWEKLGWKLKDSPLCPDEGELAEIGRHCTSTEARAEEAEESLRQFLILQMLQSHVGESFPGMVTNATNAGVFVQLTKYLASGLVKSEDLDAGEDERGRRASGAWRLDQRTGRLTHQGSGRSYGVGDLVQVTIAKIDLAMRRMDLTITRPSTGRREGVVGGFKKGSKSYPKRGFDGVATPSGPVSGNRTRSRTGKWEEKTGQSSRNQRSKRRERGKRRHR
ncbi:MAG: VacB/RNase II family 3'-5' exoribonuclease [Phycisphaeraceae bacterium]|nr:VacB/RNase II family 3'-5' exoribonuclease [Phycisphaeraceae bacterium]